MRKIFLTSLVALSTLCQAQPKYDYKKMQLENLGRGVVCVNQGDSTIISWRLLREDGPNTAFNVYCNDKRLNDRPLTQSTFFRTLTTPGINTYEVRTVDKGKESNRKNGSFTVKPDNGDLTAGRTSGPYISIPLNMPYDDFVADKNQTNSYRANDCSVGDVDGDGEYEIILKWEGESRDNAQEGVTSPVFIDCYKIDGTQLWRINLGRNIRSGAHYTQFMVFDFDGDGKAEVVMKTADGTVDGAGNVIGDPNANYVFSGILDKHIDGKSAKRPAEIAGRILEGPEYLTIFNGATGEAIHTTNYIPARGDVSSWGDSYGNRCDRFLACVAYLDGKRPSVVMCRGYYTRSVLAAFDFDGRQLKTRWVFDSDVYDKKYGLIGNKSYGGQGNHNLRVGDVDGDGCDEITYGSMCVNNDGTGLYNTGLGHGDAMHQTAFFPGSDALYVWDCHENKVDGSDFRDAKTGKVIFKIPSNTDVGRCMAADIDPTNWGLEMWSASQRGYYDVKGVQHHGEDPWIPQNSAVWWDGDKLRELLDKGGIWKYDWTTGRTGLIKDFHRDGCEFNNGSKQNVCLSADIFGDWREEVIVRTDDSSELRIYTTTIPTDYRFVTFMQDIPYRIGVATENVAYNQPPEPGFYFGSDDK